MQAVRKAIDSNWSAADAHVGLVSPFDQVRGEPDQ
jgi:hypothetical protein